MRFRDETAEMPSKTSGEPGRRQVRFSGVSAVAVEAFVNNAAKNPLHWSRTNEEDTHSGSDSVITCDQN